MDNKQAVDNLEIDSDIAIDILRLPSHLARVLVGGDYAAAVIFNKIANLIEQQDKIIQKVFAPMKQCDCEGKKEKCDVLDLGIAPYDACEYYWLCEIAWQLEEAQHDRTRTASD